MRSECLKLTPMRLANVPPPMALHEIVISSTIIDVAITIRSNPRPSAIIGVLHQQGYSQYEWSMSSMAQNPPVCRFTYDFWSTTTDSTTNQNKLYLQTSFSGSTGLLFSKSIDKSTFTVVGEDGEHMGQILYHETDIEGMIRESRTSKSRTYVTIDNIGRLNNRELEERAQNFDDVDMTGIELALSPFPTQRIDAIACDFEMDHAVNGSGNGKETPATKGIIFSLADSGFLFANERRLAKNCTSFLVTPSHLVFTTSQHLLKFVHLTGEIESMFTLTQYCTFT